MRKFWWIPAFALLIILNGGILLWAQDNGNGGAQPPQDRAARRERMQRGAGGMLADLQLTDEQKPKVKAIMEDLRDKMQPLRQTVQEKEQAIADALKADKPDMNAIKTLVDDEATATAGMHMAMIETRLALKAVLTPEQYAKLPQFGPGMGGARMGGPGEGRRMRRGQAEPEPQEDK